MKLTLPSALLCTALTALGAAGCGSSSNSTSNTTAAPPAATTPAAPAATTPAPSSGGAASSLSLSADPSGQLKFDKTALSAKAGNVTIVLTNPSPVPHAISVTGSGVSKSGATVQTGGKSTVTVALKAGTYTFYCPVDGHRAAGMEGTLTVK